MANEYAVDTVKESLLKRLHPGIDMCVNEVLTKHQNYQDVLVLMPEGEINAMANKLLSFLGGELEQLLENRR